MRYISQFIITLIVFLAGLYVGWDRQKEKPDIIPLPKSDTVFVVLKPDTVIRDVVRRVYNIQRDTVMVTNFDTVYVNADQYRTLFSYSPPEFTAEITVYSLSAADSASFRYQMKQDYINSMIRTEFQDYPSWKKYALFGGGVIGTAIIVWMVN